MNLTLKKIQIQVVKDRSESGWESGWESVWAAVTECGKFAIHKPINDRYYSSSWVVTHVETGSCTGGKIFDNKLDALTCLNTLLEWTFDGRSAWELSACEILNLAPLIQAQNSKKKFTDSEGWVGKISKGLGCKLEVKTS